MPRKTDPKVQAVALKLLTAFTLSVFLWKAIPALAQDPSVTLGLLVAGEVLTLLIYLFSRAASTFRMDPTAVFVTLCGTFYLYFITLRSGDALVPVWMSISLQVTGICWQIAAKWCLGRSFGLLPANRGIVTRGPYRVVRHPIYLGYLLMHIGFLLGSFSLYNAAIYLALYLFQWLRITQEEGVLTADAAYQTYRSTVRYRLIPGVL